MSTSTLTRTMFTYHDLKALLYFSITAMGILLLAAGAYQAHLALMVADSISSIVTAVILSGVGIACILFGAETYYLRDDPDIWR